MSILSTNTKTGWLPGATIRATPNFALGHIGKVKAVVLHVTGGAKGKEYPNAVSWLSGAESGVSAHFVISQAGEITQLVSINDSAFANGLRWDSTHGTWVDPEGVRIHPAWVGLTIPTNPNWYTISIEHAAQSSDVWSPAMFDANTRVLQWIRQQIGIIYQVRKTLIGHNEISPVNRPYCPGPNVQWQRCADAGNSTPAPPTPAPLQKFKVVSKDALNIREGPGINPATKQLYPIALNGTATLVPGTIIEVDRLYPNGWMHISSGIGFVSGAYLQAVPE
jgi:N-acetyl-anhydromuramyl-L-alanine amidase AmpD